jgi:hypothetical protein
MLPANAGPVASSIRAKDEVDFVLTNADIATFLSLVDRANRGAAEDADKPSGDPATDPVAISAQGSVKAVFAEVHSLICIPDGRPFSDLRLLLGVLVSRSVLDASLSCYRDTVRMLQFGTDSAKKFRDFNDNAAWISAIRLLNDPEFRSRSHFNSDSLIGFERELSVGNAIKRLKAAGYRFRADVRGLLFEDNELTRCCKDLARQIRKVSGQRLLEEIFGRIAATFPFVKGRYLISRPSRSPMGMTSEPSVPYGYLINLAMGHLCTSANLPKKYPKRVKKIIDFATDVVAACDIETFSPYGHIFQNHESLPHFLQDTVLGDQLLTFRQVATHDAAEIIRGVFSWVDEAQMKAALGWSITDAIKLAKALWKLMPSKAPGMAISEAMLRGASIEPAVLGAMIRAFAQEHAEINKGFLTPSDAQRVSLFLKPLVHMGSKRLFMLSPPISAMAFYEAIATELRKWFSPQSRAQDVDKKIGVCIESTLANAFTRRGIPPSAVSKKYGTLECDLVLETAKTVFLIETKKKPLTRQAQAGNSLQTFVDLMGGVMDSQLQLGRHELQLRKVGHIEFNDGTRVYLRDRAIARLAVTLLDWGGTQDRIVLKQLASTLIGSALRSPSADTNYQRALAKANVTLSKLQDQQSDLQALGIDPRNFVGNWWFLSVPQILFVLDGVASADAFEARLRSVSAITFGQLDFYRELTNVEAWKSKV